MDQITVTGEGRDRYRVTVGDGGSTTTHLVTVAAADAARFGGGVSAEDLVAASFRFLLDREPKEAILSRFDLPIIARYFPEFRDRIGEYLR